MPQAQETLQKEIQEQQEKRALLALPEPTARPGKNPDRPRAVTCHPVASRKWHRREARIQELQREQQQLLQRQKLLLEYRQQQVTQRCDLEQQYAAAQASLAEATGRAIIS